jgi:hypothetical protein
MPAPAVITAALRSSLRQANILKLYMIFLHFISDLNNFLLTVLSHKLLISRTPEFGDRIVT